MQTPILLTEGNYSYRDLEDLKRQPHWEIKDIYQQQVAELYEINHPGQAGQSFRPQSISDNSLAGNWVYYPWSGVIVHTVPELDYYRLRTNRNQLLITADEQQVLYNSCIGLLGLSIGSHFATTLAYNGIAKTMKLAEFDTLSTSNLNRIQASLAEVGDKKLDIISRRLYELNPYQQIKAYPEGLQQTDLADFTTGDPKPDVIFEAVDDFAMKVKIRLAARQHAIPVIMLTNLGDSLLIDVERYDQDQQLPIFNGLIGNAAEEIINKPLTEKDKVRYVLQIVSLANTPTRALETLLAINKTLVGRPQLASTVAIGGGVAAFLARRILLNESLPSGRYRTEFISWFNITDQQSSEYRQSVIAQLQQGFDV